MDKVIVHLDNEEHILDIRKVRGEVGVRMGNKSLFKGVNCNDPAGGIVDRIWSLAKVRTPSLEAKFGELDFDILDDVFLNRKELASDTAAIADRHRRTDLDDVGTDEWLPIGVSLIDSGFVLEARLKRLQDVIARVAWGVLWVGECPKQSYMEDKSSLQVFQHLKAKTKEQKNIPEHL